MITFEQNMFHLRGKDISYIIEISKEGYLYHRYFGKKLSSNPAFYQPWLPVWASYHPENDISLEAAAQEYPAYGLTDLKTPAYLIQNRYGNTMAEPVYRSHRIFDGKPRLAGLPATYDNADTAQTLEITVQDDVSGIRLVHSYTVFEEFDVVCRNTKIINMTDTPLRVEAAASACLDLPDNGYEATYLAGRWTRERKPTKVPVRQGKIEISNARGGSGHQINPFVMLSRPDATEKAGEVFGFCLVYSGNHATVIEQSQYQTTRVIMGINPFCFEAEVSDEFQTPECILAYSAEGFGALSRTYHDLIRNNLCRGTWKHTPRPIVVNNWEATVFDFNEEKLLEIVETASRVGIDMFVLDDGWFGKRDDDFRSLGDWVVNKKKLPSGIDGLAKKVNQHNMGFGLWFEPEMVNPDSDLYRAHPDWAIHVPGRRPVEARHQLVLDLTKPEVRDYIIESVSAVLSQANVSYVKWDMNRHIGDMPYPGFNHAYILGLYQIIDTLTTRFPDVLFESCSGGGGRFDAGLLYYMPQVWTSDNTDAIDRCMIQYGTSFAYPPCTMSAHVTSTGHSRHIPATLKTKADVAYCAIFGYELDLTALSDADLEEIRQQIALYRTIQPLVMQGDFYRLTNPLTENLYGWELAAKDGSEAFACFVLTMAEQYGRKQLVRFEGLEPNALYRERRSGACYTGDILMYMGIALDLSEGDFQSATFHFQRIQ